MKRFVVFALLILSVLISSCPAGSAKVDNDAVILFTNDIQLAVSRDSSNGSMGYASIKALKDYAKNSLSSRVLLVDAGGLLYGDGNGKFTTEAKKEAASNKVVSFINEAGYDYVVFSDDDLMAGDNAPSRLSALSPKILASNLVKTPKVKDSRFSMVKTSYVVEKFGSTKVAFIGVTTTDANQYFGNENWTVSAPDASSIQTLIDDAKNKKDADHVVLLSHLGASSITSLVANLEGLSAVIDGHTQDGVDTEGTNQIASKGGKNVYYGHCGFYGAKAGMLKIKKGVDSDTISLSYFDIDDVPFEDSNLKAEVDKIK